MKGRRVLMLGTSEQTRGGIASVLRVLREGGLFERCGIEYLATHRDADRLAKLALALRAWLSYVPRLLRREAALVHLHVASRAGFWRELAFMLPAFALRVPAVLHLHGGEFHLFHDRECGRWGRWWIRLAFRHAARVVVLSNTWAAWVSSRFPEARVEVIYNPVLMPRVSPAARAPGAVLFLGRLGESKGVFHLIEAAARLACQGVDIRLWLGGDGAVEEARARAAALGIADRVELLGWVSGEEKARRLATASIFCLPSFNEGLPMSVLEAMAAGLPVVSTPVGGIPEAVSDGVEGFLVKPGDIDRLGERLARLLGDAALRQRMGEAARRKIEDVFSAERILPRLQAVYAEIGAETCAETCAGRAFAAPGEAARRAPPD